MSEKIWSFDELAFHAKSEDPDVRCWAVERLVQDAPERAAGVVAILLLDDHDETPNIVAEHLGRYGDASHVPILTRAFRRMGGGTPGLCFDALARLSYPGIVALAQGALEKGDLTPASIGMVLEALADQPSPEAHALVRETLDRRVELLVEPPALHALVRASSDQDLPKVVDNLARALQWRGLGQAGELFRALTDELEVDDCGWCLRTGPDGRVDLRRTLRAIETSYDCEILAEAGSIAPDEGSAPGKARGTLEIALKAEGPRGMSREVARELVLRIRSGDPTAFTTGLEAYIRAKAALVPRLPGDTLPDRIAAFASALTSSDHRLDADRLGPAYHQWVTSALLSCAVKLARYRNYRLEVERAGTDLDALLALLGEETAFLSERLGHAIAEAVGEGDPTRAIEACVRILESRGPFFPQVFALDTLGHLRAEERVPEILDCLGDDNTYIYAAAEQALEAMGDALVPAVRGRLQAGALDAEAAESVLMVLGRLGTRDALALVLEQFEDFTEELGPGAAADWLALFGARELLEPLRKLVVRDPARVGPAALLLAAIHNVRLPEEPTIRAAIEDYWRRRGDDEDGGGDDEGSDRWIM